MDAPDAVFDPLDRIPRQEGEAGTFGKSFFALRSPFRWRPSTISADFISHTMGGSPVLSMIRSISKPSCVVKVNNRHPRFVYDTSLNISATTNFSKQPP